jgi:uncharacterized protein YwgA
MKRLQRAAILLSLAEKLRAKESWCGETHLQKGAYLLQEMLGIPLELEYHLYKHGPYSFELSDELTSLRADRIFDQEVQQYPYGPKLKPGTMADKVKETYPKTLNKYDQAVTFVADHLGDSGVAVLEGLATALYVTKEGKSGEDVSDRAVRLREIKPHVSQEDARFAVCRIDHMRTDWASLIGV